MALFYVNKQGDLIPIAIQLFQEPEKNNPVQSLKNSLLILTNISNLRQK